MEEIKEKLIDFITEKGGISFVEYEEFLEKNGFDYNGDLAIINNGYNIVYWNGLNDDASTIICGLIKDNKIELTPCMSLIYAIDGKRPNYPIVKMAKVYKEPHWCPVYINLKV